MRGIANKKWKQLQLRRNVLFTRCFAPTPASFSLQDIGFFGVIGHGVADGTLADLRSAASTFFASTPQAAAARASVKLPEASYPYGYAPLAR